MDLDDYAAHDGLGLAERIATGEVSAEEVARAALAAIEAVDPALGAVVECYDDGVDNAAAGRLGEGPFRGVPFLIKDVGQHFAGRRSESASRLVEGLVVERDSNFATLVKASGVNLVGRSNTPEFSMALCAENLLHGNTTTPWKAGYSTSGSSGGAAAAVAAGLVPLAHGSDMGGSIRGPAAWCGTIGLYPSRGRVSSGPALGEGGWGMTQAFVQSRTMRDTAAMLDCLGKPMPGDPFVVWRPAESFARQLHLPRPRLTIAYSARPLMDAPVDPEIAAAVERTAHLLEEMGHRVDEAAPAIDMAQMDRLCLDIWYRGFDVTLDGLAARMGRTVGPDTVERATLKFYHFARERSAEAMLAALADLNLPRRAMGTFFARHDLWLTPTAAQVSRPWGTYGMNLDLEPLDFLVHEQRATQFMVPYNITGQPAISLPLAMHGNGLPIGLQLGARHGEEHLLLQVGADLEEAMPWKHRVPPIHVARRDDSG